MLIRFITSIILFVSGILVYVGAQPSEYLISRQVVINASAEKIFPFINSAKKINDWHDLKIIDSTAKLQFMGTEEGLGSQIIWEDGKKLGSGSATIIESVNRKLVKSKLVYYKPFTMAQDVTMEIKSEGTQNIVIWSVQGSNTFIGRLFCFFSGGMESLVGKMFEDSLKKLKEAAEKS